MSKKNQPTGNISSQELAATLDVPAIFSNKTYLTNTPTGIRITFAETHPNVQKPKCHVSVILNPIDCIQLKDLLDQAIGKYNITHEKVETRTLQ